MAGTAEKNLTGMPTAEVADLREADRRLEAFSIFAHDLESPFASVKYLLGQIESGKFDRERPEHQRLLRSSRIALERAAAAMGGTALAEDHPGGGAVFSIRLLKAEE